MVQVARYAGGDFAVGALDAGYQAPSTEKGLFSLPALFSKFLPTML
jgi:hypothetical protein